MLMLLVNLIGKLLSPLVFLIGMMLLACWRSKNLSTRLALGLIALLLYAFSSYPLAYWALYPLEGESFQLEQEFAHRDKGKEARAIIVLGGGLSYHGAWREASLPLDALARVSTAAQLYHSLEGQLPVVSSGLGFPAEGEPAESEVMTQALKALQVDKTLAENRSRNTYENAVETKALLQARGEWYSDFPIILITSALHLPRAVACFRQQGFSPIPLASHYRGSESLIWQQHMWVPKTEYLLDITQALHEYIGLWYYKLTYKI